MLLYLCIKLTHDMDVKYQVWNQVIKCQEISRGERQIYLHLICDQKRNQTPQTTRVQFLILFTKEFTNRHYT